MPSTSIWGKNIEILFLLMIHQWETYEWMLSNSFWSFERVYYSPVLIIISLLSDKSDTFSLPTPDYVKRHSRDLYQCRPRRLRDKTLVSPVHNQNGRTAREWVINSFLALLQSGVADLGSSDDTENEKRNIKLQLVLWIKRLPNNLWTVLLNCGVGEDSWESLGLQGDATSPF